MESKGIKENVYFHISDEPVSEHLEQYKKNKNNIIDIIKDYKIYIASIIRLLIIPAATVLVLKWAGVEESVCMIALCTTAMPFGLNGIIFPAAYNQDTKTGAGMALISDLLAIITIPVIFSLFL